LGRTQQKGLKMALTEIKEIDRVEVVSMGIVQVRQATVIEKDGVQVARTFHRWVLTPDSDISGQEQKVKDICNAAWTEEVKSAYEAFKAEQSARLGVSV
jgi:hypothetical protein